MRVDLVDPEGTILREIADPRMKQADIALTYAFALRQEPDNTDWSTVNRAIVERWSMSGLSRIKALAWKRYEGG